MLSIGLRKFLEIENMMMKSIRSFFAEGWTVIRFWGKDINNHTDECVRTVEETIFDLLTEDKE